MNENKFDGLASIYSKHRPTYPEALIDYLYNEIGLSNKSVIADIGSGTGILTELLLKRKSKIFAIEPNEDMRKTAETNLGHFSKFISVGGSAENISLANGSVDFITVAQAFHWFDRLLFKIECKRILKPNGKVIIVYNNRDNLNPITIENVEINKRYCPAFKGFSGGMAAATANDFSDFFKCGICEFKSFQNDLLFDKQSFVGKSLSTSYAPRECDENYNSYINELEILFKKYSIDGLLHLPTITVSFTGEV